MFWSSHFLVALEFADEFECEGRCGFNSGCCSSVGVVFAAELAWMQLLRGLHFILDNPLTSMAWQLDEMQELLNEPMVHRVVIDQCYFGLMNEHGELHRKPTQLVTSSQVLVSKMLGCRCQGGHTHAPVIGGSKVTRPAGHYPRALASAMVSAMQDQFNFETKSLYVLDEPYEALAVEEVEDPTYAAESAAPWQSSDDEVVMNFVGEDSKMKISTGVEADGVQTSRKHWSQVWEEISPGFDGVRCSQGGHFRRKTTSMSSLCRTTCTQSKASCNFATDVSSWSKSPYRLAHAGGCDTPFLCGGACDR